MNTDLITIGKIVKCQGVRGEMRIEPLTADPTRFEKLESIYLLMRDGVPKLCNLESIWYHKNGQLVIKLAGFDDIDMAKTLVGLELAVKSEDLIKLPEETYFYFQIIGLDVYTVEGQYLGKVEDIFPTGSNDVYVVKDKNKECLIPAIKDVIQQVDLENKRLIIKLLEGLL